MRSNIALITKAAPGDRWPVGDNVSRADEPFGLNCTRQMAPSSFRLADGYLRRMTSFPSKAQASFQHRSLLGTQSFWT